MTAREVQRRTHFFKLFCSESTDASSMAWDRWEFPRRHEEEDIQRLCNCQAHRSIMKKKPFSPRTPPSKPRGILKQSRKRKVDDQCAVALIDYASTILSSGAPSSPSDASRYESSRKRPLRTETDQSRPTTLWISPGTHSTGSRPDYDRPQESHESCDQPSHNTVSPHNTSPPDLSRPPEASSEPTSDSQQQNNIPAAAVSQHDSSTDESEYWKNKFRNLTPTKIHDPPSHSHCVVDCPTPTEIICTHWNFASDLSASREPTLSSKRPHASHNNAPPEKQLEQVH